MNHVSLCSGIGGIDLGLRQCVRNLRTIAYVEREAFAIENLARAIEAEQLDFAPIWSDIGSFPFDKFYGLVDLVSGGFPCQPFSTAGLRLGERDSRHLWPIIRGGLEACKPSWCFFENVDGISSSKSEGFHSVLHHVLVDLEKLGFKSTAGSYSAAECGAPHLRKRWFILGHAPNADRGRGKLKEEARAGKGPERGGRPSFPGEGAFADSDGPRLCKQRFALASASEFPTIKQHRGWSIEPSMGRVANGVPDRVDRLRGLGNAVVPQVAARAFIDLASRLT